MRHSFDRELEERLIKYTAIDRQADENSSTLPSTEIQLDMLRLLEAEFNEQAAQHVLLTDYGVVLATIPDTVGGPIIDLLAHVDTAPQFDASGVKPRVVHGYNCGDIAFPDAPELVLSPIECPDFGRKVGHDIVTASGNVVGCRRQGGRCDYHDCAAPHVVSDRVGRHTVTALIKCVSSEHICNRVIGRTFM